MKLALNLIPVLLLLTFGSKDISAQVQIESGYVISLSGDTVHGHIYIKPNYVHNERCDFLPKGSTALKIFYPEDILAYSIDNLKLFISKNIDMDSTGKKVFLEYLLDGVVDLYCYNQPNHTIFFIEKDSTLYALTNEEITRTIYKSDKVLGEIPHNYAKPSQRYKGTLNYIFMDQPQLRNSVNSSYFNTRSLMQIGKEYHNLVCTEYSCIDYTKTHKILVAIEPYLGYGFSWLNFDKSDDNISTNTQSIGINIRFKPGLMYTAWNFLTGFQYCHQHFEGEVQINSLRYQYDYLYRVLEIPFLAEFAITRGKIQTFVSMGYTNSFVFYQKNERTILRTLNGQETLGSTDYLHIDPYQEGFIIETGIRFNMHSQSYVHAKLNYQYRLNESNDHNANLLGFQLAYGFWTNQKARQK